MSSCLKNVRNKGTENLKRTGHAAFVKPNIYLQTYHVIQKNMPHPIQLTPNKILECLLITEFPNLFIKNMPYTRKIHQLQEFNIACACEYFTTNYFIIKYITNTPFNLICIVNEAKPLIHSHAHTRLKFENAMDILDRFKKKTLSICAHFLLWTTQIKFVV